MEKPTYDLEISYASILSTMFLTIFYSSILPIGIVLSIVSLIIFYWTEKV